MPLPNLNLSMTREGFINRGALLFNSLPEDLRLEPNLQKFRSRSRKWIVENVAENQFEVRNYRL